MKPQDLKQIIVFRFLRDGELLDLSKSLTPLDFQEGDLIIDEGDPGECVYFIQSGTLNISVARNDNTQAYLNVLGPGESLGEGGIFPKMARTARVTAASSGLVYRWERKDLLNFISKNPGPGIKILMMLIYSLLKKLQGLNQELAYERQGDAGQDEVDNLVQDFMKDL
ncbi:MAG: hypothetical protein A2Z96_06155 [Spirochaetes bacterium GWB1_48_6]|nr:MAG: hypothetical protein A2Z96_06155 [Spirochaetes bacterium GWB1_48_6]